MNKIVVENRKFQIDLVIIKNINHNLEKIVYLEEKKKSRQKTRSVAAETM